MKELTEMRPINKKNVSAPIRAAVLTFFFLLTYLYPCEPGICEEKKDSFDFLLTAPTQEIHQQYLGISSDKSFSLGEIKARVVIIEIFSMYCPICQREAADVNELFRLIQENPALRDKIKLIGIGAGNSEFEVDFFREKYHIEFPLFSDRDFLIHKKVGGVRTPHFFGLLVNKNAEISVFYSRTGEMTSPE